jgi:formate-nitrite transporter family protein
VILGREALFTEGTLTAALPVLVRRDRHTLELTLRFWLVVLSCNLIGTFIFAALISVPAIFPEPVVASLNETARMALRGTFLSTLIKAILAGWLIALVIWMLPQCSYFPDIGHFDFDVHRRDGALLSYRGRLCG